MHLHVSRKQCPEKITETVLMVRHALSGLLPSPAQRNSPQRPGEKIRVEPNNFTAVYLTITDTSPPPDPSPFPHSLCLYVFSVPPTLQSSAAFGADSTELDSYSQWVSSVRMRSVRLPLLWMKDGEEEDGAPLNWSL